MLKVLNSILTDEPDLEMPLVALSRWIIAGMSFTLAWLSAFDGEWITAGFAATLCAWLTWRAVRVTRYKTVVIGCLHEERREDCAVCVPYPDLL